MTLPRTVADVLSGHVNVWQPQLALGGGVAGFFTGHRGNVYASTATRLSRGTAGVLACVWATKQHSPSSLVRIEQAAPASARPPFDRCYTVRTDTSSQSEAFKEQIRDQLGTAWPLPPGPVQIQLCFTVGPSRNWLNLWKPTLDAFGQILGHAPAAAPWAPLDGRIVDLGLHCRVRPVMRNDVLITIAAKHIRGPGRLHPS